MDHDKIEMRTLRDHGTDPYRARGTIFAAYKQDAAKLVQNRICVPATAQDAQNLASMISESDLEFIDLMATQEAESKQDAFDAMDVDAMLDFAQANGIDLSNIDWTDEVALRGAIKLARSASLAPENLKIATSDTL